MWKYLGCYLGHKGSILLELVEGSGDGEKGTEPDMFWRYGGRKVAFTYRSVCVV